MCSFLKFHVNMVPYIFCVILAILICPNDICFSHKILALFSMLRYFLNQVPGYKCKSRECGGGDNQVIIASFVIPGGDLIIRAQSQH